jgi:tRNA A-37 threonylcarbamoyl transferase component Bud32
MMDEYFEKLKQEAEENNTGLTNDVFFTKKGTVVKTYSRYPLTSFLESFTELVNGKINYISRDERMSNEVETKKLIEDLGFGTAQVLEIGEESIEFEKVPGIDGFAFLTKASNHDSEEMGRKIGDFLSEIHSRGVAMNDFRLSNIHVSDSLELHYIDHEYSKLEAKSWLQKVDQLTLFSSARQTGNFSPFLEGFKQSNSSIKIIPLGLSIFIFGYHAVLLERDLEKFVRGMKSVFVW